MNKIILILLFCSVSVIPCFAKGHKDKEPEPVKEQLLMNPQKKVEGLSVSDGRLSIEGDMRDIAYSLDNKEALEKLKNAETYSHIIIDRPDGPIGMLELKNDDDLLCWVGDGVRANMGPSGLKIFPEEGVNSIKVNTNGKSWTVSLRKETPIIWNDKEYIVFVSRIDKGTMQDQPKFAVDLVIMRK